MLIRITDECLIDRDRIVSITPPDDGDEDYSVIVLYGESAYLKVTIKLPAKELLDRLQRYPMMTRINDARDVDPEAYIAGRVARATYKKED